MLTLLRPMHPDARDSSSAHPYPFVRSFFFRPLILISPSATFFSSSCSLSLPHACSSCLAPFRRRRPSSLSHYRRAATSELCYLSLPASLLPLLPPSLTFSAFHDLHGAGVEGDAAASGEPRHLSLPAFLLSPSATSMPLEMRAAT